MTRQNDSTSKSSTEEQLDQAQLIEETGGVRPQNARHLIHCLNIIGQVEGHNVLPEDTKTTKYEHVLPALVAIEQDREIEGLLILLNTMGGDVEAGLAIAEMIAGMHIYFHFPNHRVFYLHKHFTFYGDTSYGTPPVRVIVSQNDYMCKADALVEACGAPNPAGNEYGNLKSISFC